MSEPFLAEIRLFGFAFAPSGWAACDGQILPISQNQALYSLLGTTYGGDGETTFGLPDLRGRVPIHLGSSGGAPHYQGDRGGEERVALTEATMPAHGHGLQAFSDNANSTEPEAEWLAHAESNLYVGGGTPVALRAGSITNNTGGQPHQNMQPSLVLQYCIAVQGTFPSSN